MPDTASRQKWRLSQEAFDRLLAALGDDRDAAAERYERIRARLIKFFAWERCAAPEDHADETINRVAKRVSEGEVLGNAEGYFAASARLVLREVQATAQRQARALDEFVRTRMDDPAADEATAARLDECLAGLTLEQREFLLEYYQGEQRARIENRQRLAARLNLPLNAVRNRALRLRERLEDCLSVIFHTDAPQDSRRTDG